MVVKDHSGVDIVFPSIKSIEPPKAITPDIATALAVQLLATNMGGLKEALDDVSKITHYFSDIEVLGKPIETSKKGEDYSMKIVAKKGQESQSVQKSKEKPVSNESSVDTDATQVPFNAEVMVEASMTINLGDYNSAKIGCSLKLPCAVHEVDQTFESVKNWVEDRMESMISEVKDK